MCISPYIEPWSASEKYNNDKWKTNGEARKNTLKEGIESWKGFEYLLHEQNRILFTRYKMNVKEKNMLMDKLS